MRCGLVADRYALVFVCTSLALAPGCTEDARSASTPTGDRGPESVERIRTTALHASHVAADEPVACEACHEKVAGQYLEAKSWQCKSCHEDTRLALHAASFADSGARECVSCHDFTSHSDNPIACISCHTDAQGSSPAIRLHDPAKPDEDCGSCHRAHEEPTLVTTACESCHTDEPVSGHDKPDIQITGCASCHGYHEEADVASGRCTNCHRQSRAHVPASATFADGHDECVSCHRPHRFFASEVIGCKDECHDGRVAISERKVPEHRGCTGCHDNHDVGKSPAKMCETCHKKQPQHPADRVTKSTCMGCHKPHQSSGAPLATPCSDCHDDVKSDRARHGVACRSCHEPHAFDLKDKGVALCRDCHGARPFKGAPSIQAHAKHSDCFACHGDTVAHEPTGERVACATCHKAEAAAARKDHRKCVACHEPHTTKQKAACSGCHEPQARTAPAKHRDCMQCHDQHSTTVKQACASCHADRTTGVHAGVKGSCASCHRPHGPGGVASPPACTSCHDKGLPGLHQEKDHADCSKCHVSHGDQPYRGRASCLACHDDKNDHEPDAVTCMGCHIFGGDP